MNERDERSHDKLPRGFFWLAIKRPARKLLAALHEMRAASGLSLEVYCSQVLETAAAQFRALPITPKPMELSSDDMPLERVIRRKGEVPLTRRRTLSVEMTQRLIHAHTQGVGPQELAQRFGISVAYACRICAHFDRGRKTPLKTASRHRGEAPALPTTR